MKKRMMMKRVGFLVLCFAGFFWCGGSLAAPQQEGAGAASGAATAAAKGEQPKPKALSYIAIVNGQQVSMAQYISALRRGIKERFYHGKVEEEEAKKYRKEVADKLIERALLVQEAKRRHLKPNATEVEKNVKAFDEKFKDDPEWAKARDEVLLKLRDKLNDDSLAKELKASVLTVKAPTEAELRQYYDAHHDLFTTPERVRVSLILLRVDPSSTQEVWKQASEEATSIVAKISAGADFGELARIHSSDKSAQKGGDMGFVHTGMLGENASKVLDIMEPGEVSAPVVMLEGVAIFRLDEREKPLLNSFEDVKERAAKLYKRDKGDEAWKKLLADLHNSATIEVNDAPWR